MMNICLFFLFEMKLGMYIEFIFKILTLCLVIYSNPQLALKISKYNFLLIFQFSLQLVVSIKILAIIWRNSKIH